MMTWTNRTFFNVQNCSRVGGNNCWRGEHCKSLKLQACSHLTHFTHTFMQKHYVFFIMPAAALFLGSAEISIYIYILGTVGTVGTSGNWRRFQCYHLVPTVPWMRGEEGTTQPGGAKKNMVTNFCQEHDTEGGHFHRLHNGLPFPPFLAAAWRRNSKSRMVLMSQNNFEIHAPN